ncbi:hypothetical protein CJ195_24530 [Bacillus sp. UMB0899]|nr:hypothetical protein CJ195_24530 [Bacillus sp. UMB0899]
MPAYLEETAMGLLLQQDINDRYAYNYIKGYTSTSEKVKEILDLTTDIVENKVKDIVMNGVVEL